MSTTANPLGPRIASARRARKAETGRKLVIAFEDETGREASNHRLQGRGDNRKARRQAGIE
jgi:hypothetical protein